jgi:HSP20 family protein
MAKDIDDRLADSIEYAVQNAHDPVTVPVNMYEADEAYVVIAPLPGVMPDDIDVRLEGKTLGIAANMRTPAVKAYLMHEWHYGPYERTVDLPRDVSGRIETSFGNGQLAVRVFKS